MRYAETLSGDMTLRLPEFDDPPPDPVPLLRRWLRDAEDADVREPRAASLATADASGRVWSRIVLVKDVADDGVLLGFASGSRKGTDLAANPQAALNFYWRERAQQVTVAGPVRRADPATSDALFGSRPRAAQALAVRSRQTAPATDLDGLRRDVDGLTDSGGPIARPPTWSGWIIALDEIEFWHGSRDRFHRRLRYRRRDDHYCAQRLQP